jgi:hypothetical protein
VPGRAGSASVLGIECCESGAPKGAERFQTGHEALGRGRLPQRWNSMPICKCLPLSVLRRRRGRFIRSRCGRWAAPWVTAIGATPSRTWRPNPARRPKAPGHLRKKAWLRPRLFWLLQTGTEGNEGNEGRSRKGQTVPGLAMRPCPAPKGGRDGGGGMGLTRQLANAQRID